MCAGIQIPVCSSLTTLSGVLFVGLHYKEEETHRQSLSFANGFALKHTCQVCEEGKQGDTWKCE